MYVHIFLTALPIFRLFIDVIFSLIIKKQDITGWRGNFAMLQACGVYTSKQLWNWIYLEFITAWYRLILLTEKNQW